MKNQDNDTYSLAHTRWKCQYHLVFTPKYHRKIIYGTLRAEIGKILRELCKRKDVEIIEAHAMPDHIHMLVSIPPNEKVCKRSCRIVKKDMSAVPSEETRIQEISEGWRSEFSKLFLWIAGPPLPEGKGGEAYILAERALIKSQPQELSGYSLLQEAVSREQAVRRAELLIQEQAEAVQRFLVPAEWLKRAEEKCAMPWNEEVSSLREDYEAFLREYDALSENERRYIASKTLLCIQKRYRLSQSKGEAVTLLKDIFSDYSSEEYLISDWENLVEIWNQCIADAEQAEVKRSWKKL